MAQRQSRLSRRRVLKASSIGVASALAGCTGGGNGTSNGNTGLTITVPASGYWVVMMKHLESENVLSNNLEEAGYEIEDLQYTWDGAPLFAAGQADISHLAGLEMARLGSEQEMETVVSGQLTTNFLGIWTRPGTPYDPDEAGSKQAAVDNIIGDNTEFLIDGWGSGTIPPARIAMDEYGYAFEENGDFNVVTAELTAIPTLIADGTADVGLLSPMHGAGQLVLDEDIKPILQYPSWSNEQIGYVPSLTNVTVSRSFFDENAEAVQAMVDTWDEGLQWLHETGSDALETEDDLTDLGCRTMEGGEYAMEWGLGNQDVPYALSTSAVHESGYMTDEYIDGQVSFLESVAERGMVPSDWAEYVSFEKVDQ
ncbi:hypothetical protein [Natrinema longum]|uniref:hypothetical protein n=1 Tax=Natrinema longum TaxID=370324 RepID=UPI001CCD9110|nr:hypothetical protein [Natrinema longum]MBZ6497089.1 hypothetical protein [Natrinema longum]